LRRFAASGATSASARAGVEPVVVRDPEGELDERRRDFAEHRLDRADVDARGRSVLERDDDPSCARASERHADDRPHADVVGHLVGELARDRAGRHQRIDRREGHRLDRLVFLGA